MCQSQIANEYRLNVPYTYVYVGDGGGGKLVQICPMESLWEPAYLGVAVHQQGYVPALTKERKTLRPPKISSNMSSIIYF